ncbi:MAG: glycosyltransferase [Sphingomonadaceae bacterium]|nr:glycosyltransferase [Sphingomonadaceae bacterium]
MSNDARPIFFDQSGRRKRRFTIGVVAFLALILLALLLFVTSIVEVAPQRQLPFEAERTPIHGARGPVGALAHDAKKRLNRVIRDAGWFLPGSPSKPATPSALSVAFHAPWDDASAASLQRHVNDVDWLIPAWMSVSGPRFTFTVFPDVRAHEILASATHRPKLLPMVQDAIQGTWDPKNAAGLLHDPRSRARFLDVLEQQLLRMRADGACFDIEAIPPSAQADYLRLLNEANTRFDRHGWLLTVAVPVGDPDWNLKAYAAIADKIFLMAYDEHDDSGDPGPIASQGWFIQTVAHALQGVPRDKVVVALGSYSYDWGKGVDTDTLSVEDAWLRAHESNTIPSFDKASANSVYDYDENGVHHEVWIEDAATIANEMAILRRSGLQGFALWRLGTEDPSIWELFGRAHANGADPRTIRAIPAGTDVDIEGSGEILRVGSVPVPGFRDVALDNHGLIADLRFTQLPLPYTIERAGYRPGYVALTFDDGPDANFTPKILDILRAKGVHATFFIIGENALTNRGLLNRLVAEGHEIGNHTYTHPNLGRMTTGETDLELNATQRLFQAFTGRSMRLFRAPYFGDAEPTTADEIDAVWRGQQLGYLSVGLHVDAQDWQRPGVPAIIRNVMDGVASDDPDRSAQVVLLHDSGGDRRQTIEALPTIIDQLRAKGYKFVTASQLIGLTQDQVMPRIAASDRLAARMNLALFSTLGFIVQALHWLFAIAISVGIARSVLLSALALWQARRENRTVFPPIDPDRFVSVLIPAFNEARVIERSVRRVLDSRDVEIEVIVIDDGSKDETSAIVRAAFADEPRVRLLTLENGGKARALNQGLLLARGEIVIALDADTQFEPTTIARLARWFVDPTIGAVAGNAKVGNRINLVTRWQALEYVTAQNLERRALAALGAMTVVPGAVGAWRAATLREIGGYPSDTLAEDQDLTIAIQRAGWDVRYDQYAVAWTEAPENAAGLAKQRFRWAFGTLQCLWKHRAVMAKGKPRGLAYIGLPQAILFQIGFAAISPVIDLALIVNIAGTYISVHEHGWAATQTDLYKMLIYWLLFTMIDVLSGVIAFALERHERWRLLALMIPQRVGYRQIMYYVVLKALAQAARGPRVGWGKLERSGRVEAA